MGYPQIVITGDSISQQSFTIGGYGAALVDMYNGKMDVLNRGMGGWNSRQLLQYLKSDMDVSKTADVRLFIIHVGGNDMCIGGLQSVLLPDYASNLRMIISHIRNTWYQASVLLVTPTFLDAERLKAFDRSLGIPPDLAPLRTDENAKRYVDACLLVGKETDTPVINVYQLHTEAREAGHTLKELFWDGLHYTPFGYSTINAAIVRAIDATCPASSAAAMPAAFPGYSTYACENDPRSVRITELEKTLARVASGVPA